MPIHKSALSLSCLVSKILAGDVDPHYIQTQIENSPQVPPRYLDQDEYDQLKFPLSALQRLERQLFGSTRPLTKCLVTKIVRGSLNLSVLEEITGAHPEESQILCYFSCIALHYGEVPSAIAGLFKLIGDPFEPIMDGIPSSYHSCMKLYEWVASEIFQESPKEAQRLIKGIECQITYGQTDIGRLRSLARTVTILHPAP